MKSKSLAIKRTGFFHHYSPQQQARILLEKFLFLFQIKTVPRSRFASGTTEWVKKFKIDFLSEAFFLDSHGELSTAAVVF
jgi:hypothetical protein